MDIKGEKLIVYVGNFSFPDGNASGKRVYANGKLFRELGFDVRFIGVDKVSGSISNLVGTKSSFDGFSYYNLSYPVGLSWVKYKPVVRAVEELVFSSGEMSTPAIMVFYGSPTLSPFITSMIKICKKHGTRTITDCVDWLTPKSGSIAFDVVKWLDATYQKAYANTKVDGVIAISSYLSNYYRKRKMETVILPPLTVNRVDIAAKPMNAVLHIIYAGFWPAEARKIKGNHKDRLDKTIELLAEVKKGGCRFVFDVYGLTRENYLRFFPQHQDLLEELGHEIVFHGEKKNQEVMDAVRVADYSILLRDRTRDTMAGFPTKVSESIGCGTPVITTRTSDIERYLEEDSTVYLLDIKDTKEAAFTLGNILSQNRVDGNHASIVYNPFHFSQYTQITEQFLDRTTIE